MSACLAANSKQKFLDVFRWKFFWSIGKSLSGTFGSESRSCKHNDVVHDVQKYFFRRNFRTDSSWDNFTLLTILGAIRIIVGILEWIRTDPYHRDGDALPLSEVCALPSPVLVTTSIWFVLLSKYRAYRQCTDWLYRPNIRFTNTTPITHCVWRQRNNYAAHYKPVTHSLGSSAPLPPKQLPTGSCQTSCSHQLMWARTGDRRISLCGQTSRQTNLGSPSLSASASSEEWLLCSAPVNHFNLLCGPPP